MHSSSVNPDENREFPPLSVGSSISFSTLTLGKQTGVSKFVCDEPRSDCTEFDDDLETICLLSKSKNSSLSCLTTIESSAIAEVVMTSLMASEAALTSSTTSELRRRFFPTSPFVHDSSGFDTIFRFKPDDKGRL